MAFWQAENTNRSPTRLATLQLLKASQTERAVAVDGGFFRCFQPDPVSREAADPRQVPDVDVHTSLLVVLGSGLRMQQF
jgi:hypothetical protein